MGWVGLGWVVLQACFVGWVGSISYWVGLGWITENGPTSMSGRTPGRILTIYGLNDASSPKDLPFGGLDDHTQY